MTARAVRAAILLAYLNGHITDQQAGHYYALTKDPTMRHTPITIHHKRPHHLLAVEEFRVIDGELCVIGVFADRHGVTRALARAAVVTLPETVTTP